MRFFSDSNLFRIYPAVIVLMLTVCFNASSQVISGETKSIKIRSTEVKRVPENKPPLEANAVFSDQNKTGILEADENGIIEVEIRNNGIKTAYDVKVSCTEPERQTKGLTLSSPVSAGDILSGESRKVSLALSADSQIGNQEIRLLITVTDRTGNRAEPVTLGIRSRPVYAPVLMGWISPAVRDTTVFQKDINIQLKISSTTAVRQVSLLNNSIVQVISYSLTKPGQYYSLTYNQQLTPGNNLIEITVENEDQQMAKESLNVFYIQEKRLALIIGNADYVYGGQLSNPVNDARAMENILNRVGFDVMKYENLNQKDMKKAIDNFGVKLSGYDVGLFYYAGHGIQSDGYNYLIPVEAQLLSYEDIEYDCVRADRILSKMEYAATDVNILILDACRNNPFERQWNRAATGKGLAFMDAPSGSMIAYATSPGRTAADGSGKNGLYTSALLKYIQQGGLQIEEVFKNVRKDVESISGGSQIPWESTSLKGQFYFKR
jgi:hypothetical protein